MSGVDEQHKREYLRPYLGKRITIEGRIQKWGEFWDGRMRLNVPSVCVQDVDVWETDKSRWSLCDHVWVAYVDTITQTGARIGDVVKLSALAYSYPWTDRDNPANTYLRFGLRDPVDVEIVRRLETRNYAPRPPTLTPGPSNGAVVAVAEPPPIVVASPRPQSRVALMDVLELIDKHGLDAVERAVRAAKAMEQ